MTERHFIAKMDKRIYWVIRKNVISFNVCAADRTKERGEFFAFILRTLKNRNVNATARLRGEHMFDVKFKDWGELQLMSKGLLNSKNVDIVR